MSIRASAPGGGELDPLTAQRISQIENNLAINTLNDVIQEGKVVWNMDHQLVDAFTDETGVENKVNLTYDQGLDYYYPTPASSHDLLLQSETTSDAASVVDSSGNGNVLTVVGSATAVRHAPQPYGQSSLLFDRNGCLTVPDSPDFDFGTNDFTIEAWIFNETTGNSSFPTFIGKYNGAGTLAWSLLFVSSTTLRFQYSTDGSTTLTFDFAGAITKDNWHHVAVCRSGNDFRAFVDGVQLGSTQDFTGVSLFNSPAEIRIGIGQGGTPSLTYGYAGMMQDVRISDNARYTTNFTSPTSAFTSDANTLFLLQSDDVVGSTTFTDSSSYSRTITNYSGSGVRHFLPQFGNSALYFNGANASLTTPDSASWNFSNSDFTVEAWVYIRSLAALNAIVAQNPSTNFSWELDIQPDGSPRFKYSLDGVSYATDMLGSPGAVTVNNWHHVAVCRSGNTINIFVDGVVQATRSETGTLNDSDGILEIGVYRATTGDFIGFMEELSVTNGTARYTADFSSQLPGQFSTSAPDVSIETVAVTSASTPSKARALIWIDPTTTVTPNTDIFVSVSRDGGTTWTNGVLAYAADYDSNVQIFAADDIDLTAQPTGSEIKLRAWTQNSLDFQLHGWVLQWV